MDRIVVAVAIGMGLVFGIGMLAGFIFTIAMAVRREERRYTLTGQAPDAAARGVRRLTAVGHRNIIPPDEVQWR